MLFFLVFSINCGNSKVEAKDDKFKGDKEYKHMMANKSTEDGLSKGPILFVGMDCSTANLLMEKRFGKSEPILSIMPRQSEDGAYLEMNEYLINDNKVIVLHCAKKDGENTLKFIDIYTDLLPKNNIKMKSVDAIDTNEILK